MPLPAAAVIVVADAAVRAAANLMSTSWSTAVVMYVVVVCCSPNTVTYSKTGLSVGEHLSLRSILAIRPIVGYKRRTEV